MVSYNFAPAEIDLCCTQATCKTCTWHLQGAFYKDVDKMDLMMHDCVRGCIFTFIDFTRNWCKTAKWRTW